jgi:transposase
VSRSEEDKDALIDRLREELARFKAENELLRERMDLLLRRIFGASSEKLDAAQLELLLEDDGAKKQEAAGCDEDAPAAEPEKPRQGRKRSRPKLPEDIEVVERTVDPEEVATQPGAWRQLGEEVSERLQYEPSRYWLERTIRRTWIKRDEPDRAPVTAPLEPCLLEGSLLSPSLAAGLITAKFCEHQPFYRQAWILSVRHGIEISRQNMYHWAGVCAGWLEPLWKLQAAELRAQDWLGADETPIEYLCPGHGSTRQGYLWTYAHPQAGVLYDWHTGRGNQCLDSVLINPQSGEAWQGTLLTDGYAAYETWAKQRDGVRLAACWAHVRRKFHEAAEHHPQEAMPVLGLINALFAIEQRLRNQRAGPEEQLALRRAESLPLAEAIKEHLLCLNHCLPKSSLGRARDYTLGLWSRLLVFLEDGRVPIDNNGTENAIRPTKLGAKNWMFLGGADTGQRSAILYTMVENVRRAGADPFRYLSDVLTRLPAMTNQDDLRPLLPRHWLAAHHPQSTKVA